MNMAYNYQSESDSDYGLENEDLRGGKAKLPTRGKVAPRYGAKKSPSAHNGMHRRRNKRFAW